jgi:putative nucleotidyltransferase with HDIG domain
MPHPFLLVAPRHEVLERDDLRVEDDCTRRRALALVDLLDDALAAHARRVATLATLVAEELDVAAEVRRDVELGALLHDIGKLTIPTAILGKAGPLDDAERELMRTHVTEGERLAAAVGWLPDSVPAVVRASHERWDGSGYPDGLHGPEIPLAARVVSTVDALDAMTSSRCYRRSLTLERAIGKVCAEAGRQFDPEVTEALAVAARTAEWSSR